MGTGQEETSYLKLMRLEKKYLKLKRKSKLDNVFVWILLVLNALSFLPLLLSQLNVKVMLKLLIKLGLYLNVVVYLQSQQ